MLQMENSQWIADHARYEKRAFVIIRKNIRNIVSKIPINILDGNNSSLVVNASIPLDSIIKMYQEVYLSIGLEHGKNIVRELSNEKDIGLKSFADILKETLFSWMGANVGQRVVSVRNTLVNDIVNIINNAFGNERTILQIRSDIHKTVNSPNFYKWQALRIARTETTTIANYAALQAAKQSKLVLLKEWNSIQDDRTRHRPKSYYDHLNMDKVTAEIDEPFNVNFDYLQFPGDTNGEAGDVINCRCSLSFIPKRDINGNLILKK